MAFELKYLIAGQEVYDDIPAAVVSITKGNCIYWEAGYAGNAFASVTNALLLGVANETVDNSGGSAGDDTVSVQLNPFAVYEVGTADTMTAAYRGYNCALASASTITSASQGTDITGVFKILKMVSAFKVQGRLVFSGIADT